MSLANDLLAQFEAKIESLSLIPSDGGRFEITVNGKLLYSKLQTGRHAGSAEVIGLVRDLLKE